MMDGMEIKISNLGMGQNPVLLQLLPSEPEGNSQKWSNQTQSEKRKYGSDHQSRDPERGQSLVQSSNWLSLGSSSMGGTEKSRLKMSGLFKKRFVGGEKRAVGADNAQLRVLYVPCNPTMKLCYRQLAKFYKVSQVTFFCAIEEYFRKTNSTENASFLNKIIHQTLQNFEIPVWYFVRFLTNSSSIKRSSVANMLINNPCEEVVWAHPTLRCKPPEGSAAVIVISDGSENIPALRLCRVRIIFALPQSICEGLPTAVQATCYIPLRLAFVEWYSLVGSLGSAFYEISPMMDANAQPIGEIISVTEIKGSVPMSPKMDGLGNSNFFLVDAASVQAVAFSKCQFDLNGKKFRTLLRVG